MEQSATIYQSIHSKLSESLGADLGISPASLTIVKACCVLFGSHPQPA